MLGFGLARNRKVAAALADLRGRQADLLALSLYDIDAAATQHGLGRSDRVSLLKQLIAEAIDRDVDRLITLFRASGRSTMPPPRLVGDWAAALGADMRLLAAPANRSTASALAAEYLAVGRIDVAQRRVLEDVALAYGAQPAAALCWIEAAVSAEINRYVETVPRQGSWCQRLAGSQPR